MSPPYRSETVGRGAIVLQSGSDAVLHKASLKRSVTAILAKVVERGDR